MLPFWNPFINPLTILFENVYPFIQPQNNLPVHNFIHPDQLYLNNVLN